MADTETLRTVEITIEQAKEAIQLHEQLLSLEQNKDFKALIIDGYLHDEPARIAGMLAEPGQQGEIDQRELMGAIKSIGHIRQYLINIHRAGLSAKESLINHEEYADELRGEK